jgi:hypothetical protein
MKNREFEHLVGMNTEVARIELQSEGLVLRVSVLNGQHQELKMDYRDNRVNVIVEHGTITGIDGIG